MCLSLSFSEMLTLLSLIAMPRFAPISTLQHDAQMDYYGRRLATCSSDRLIKIYDLVGSEASAEPVQIAELAG